MDRLEHAFDRLRLAVGAKNARLLIALGQQDFLLTGALGGQNPRLPLTFGMQNGRALVPLGPHLLLHRLLDAPWWINGLDLHPVDADAPLAGGLVQNGAKLGIDRFTGGESLLQVHAADQVAQRGDGELIDGLQVVGHLIGRGPRFGDLVVEDGVDVDDEVVLGDHRLRGGREHLLADVELVAHPVGDGDDEVQTGLECGAVTAESLNVEAVGLRHNLDGHDHQKDDQERRHDDRHEEEVHCTASFR